MSGVNTPGTPGKHRRRRVKRPVPSMAKAIGRGFRWLMVAYLAYKGTR